MVVYRIEIVNPCFHPDACIKYVKSISQLSGSIKAYMHHSKLQKLTVYKQVFPKKMDRVNLLNRKGAVTSELFYQVTKEQWENPHYVFILGSKEQERDYVHIQKEAGEDSVQRPE